MSNRVTCRYAVELPSSSSIQKSQRQNNLLLLWTQIRKAGVFYLWRFNVCIEPILSMIMDEHEIQTA